MNAVIEDNCLKCGADLDNWDNNPFIRHCDKCEP
jgi:transcription initiation factor IIE alpha subunit